MADDHPARPALQEQELTQVSRYVREHINEALAVAELADLTGRSSSCFSRLFKEATGLTPHQFILRQRVDRAVELIRENSELSLSQIALRSGFADQAHLTRVFQEVTGQTPARFCRHHHRKEPR